MEEKLLQIFLKVRENFSDIKDMVSLTKPYFELCCFSAGWALKIEEFEKLLGFKPVFLYESDQKIYAICVLYRIDDEITEGIMAHEFAEIIAREKNITGHQEVDRICAEKGFGEQLLYALQNDVLPGMVEREFIVREDLVERVKNLKAILGEP
jgi:hypothetical protein